MTSVDVIMVLVFQVYHSIPNGFSFSEVKSYIEGLPTLDSPELFGMNDNAEKAYLENQGRLLIHTILAVQPQTTGASLIGYFNYVLFLLIIHSSYCIHCFSHFSSHKSNDTIVSEMASEIQQLLPHQVEPEDEIQTSRPNQPSRPSLLDIVAFSNARLTKTSSAKSNRQKSRDVNTSGK